MLFAAWRGIANPGICSGCCPAFCPMGESGFVAFCCCGDCYFDRTKDVKKSEIANSCGLRLYEMVSRMYEISGGARFFLPEEIIDGIFSVSHRGSESGFLLLHVCNPTVGGAADQVDGFLYAKIGNRLREIVK